MFCPNCGTQCAEGSAFCPNCGTSMNSGAPQQAEQQVIFSKSFRAPTQDMFQQEQSYQSQPQYQQPQPQYQPQQPYAPYAQSAEPYAQPADSYAQPADPYAQPAGPYGYGARPAQKKKLDNKMLGIIIGAAVAVVAVVVLLIVLLGGGGGAGSPEDAAEGFMEAAMSADIEGALDYVHEDMQEDMDIGEGYAELQSMLDMIDVNRIEATKSERLSKSELADLIDELEDDFTVVPEISDAYQIRVEVEVEFYGQSATEKMYVTVGEIDGNWYVVYAE